MPPGEASSQQKVTLKELFQAAQHDEFETVKDYLQIVLHGNEADGRSPSPPPSRKDLRAIIKSLLESKTKNTLLHYACDNGNLDACKYLLMVDGMSEMYLNEPNAFGHTPLFYASSSGKLPLIKWLISNGADIDTDYSDHRDIVPREGDQGIFTPLQIACFKGHEDVVNFLVECNAELSGTRRNGKTPLHFASLQNHKSIVKILLDAGADAHACDDQGKTPVDVADAAMLAILLPDEHGSTLGESDGDEIEAAAEGDSDDDDDCESGERRSALECVKNVFGNDISRGFRSKTWKSRVNAISEASLCFQSITNGKTAIKLFDGACKMMVMGFQDAVSQVVSCCCNSLLKAAFNAVMGEKEFHTSQFHRDRPVIHDIANALLSRGAGSNEKDSSEAVASLLFLISKSVDLTRYLTVQISRIMSLSATAPAVVFPSKLPDASANLSATSNVSWRHQLVSIKILNTIASKYRLDQSSSGLSFSDALKISMAALENSSVHVRSAAVDLLVQCLLIRCEQSVDEIYEQMKSWSESIFKQQNQPLKPSVQAKINNGLKNALQTSKRLNNLSSAEGEQDRAMQKNTTNAIFDASAVGMSPPSKSAQKEDDLPYAEPIQEQYKDDAADVLACFGEKVARCLFSNAWAPRVEALSFLQNQVDTRQLSFDSKALLRQRNLVHAIQRTLLQALQDRVNAVFEAGVALLMEVAIAFDSFVASAQDKTNLQDLVRPLIPRLLVKLGDSKARLHVTTEDALLLLSRQSNSIGPEFLLEEIIACDRNVAPQALSATYLGNKLTVISKLLLEFGVQESSNDEAGALQIKNVLQPALQVCEHKDQNVRQVSLQIIADTLQIARNAAMPFLDALARASRQKIISKLVEKGVLESDLLMDEVDDFDVANESSRPGTSGGFRPPTASGSSTKHRPALSNTSLSSSSSSSTSATQSQPVALPYGTALTIDQKEQYASLIEEFGEELVRCLLDKTWAQREAAIREIERQVVWTANGKAPADKALPKSIETLRIVVMALELGLNDTVARVFQCTLKLFQIVATDFVPLIASKDEYVDAILENVVGLVMQKLGDTKQRLRSDCFTLLHSLACLNHIGYARMCKMLADKYQQLLRSGTPMAASPLIAGELLKLFTLLIKEDRSSTAPSANRPDIAAILNLILPVFENKHVDVRNGAIATYVAIYEVTNGGTDESYGKGIDLNGFLAQTKPAIRDAITRSVVQISKTLPPSATNDSAEVNSPEIDSARQQPLALDINKLTLVCGSQIVTQLTSISAIQRCAGVDKLVDMFLSSPRNPAFKGAWEISCLLSKQLLVDATPIVCLAAFDLFQLLVDPPGSGGEYAIPWGEWGVHLILGSTIRSVIQQTANENVRVRARAKSLLHSVALKNPAGKSAVCNALLSAPEQIDMANEMSKRARKIATTKLRWQTILRLELIYDFLTSSAAASRPEADTTSNARRKSLNGGSSSRSSGDSLGVENVVPFLGSCATHPSTLVRSASRKIMSFLRETRGEEVATFIQDSCSAALQRRLHTLLQNDDDGDGNNADHFNAEDATCVRGSRASHVRRIAALRPPRSVPVEETKMTVDVFPPPNSAPGRSRRSATNGQDDDDSMNDGSYLVLQRGDRDERGGGKMQQNQQQQQ
uniref:TOG domain-containing protein n=1 Tax=Globisporangium ultimum (strain ATCC 200006 / CBS 805.95 / DAOM BR144) TaxID=431595 RepID=K3WLG3_GLOUD